MTERTAILIRLTRLNEDLAIARRTLQACKPSERAAVSQRIAELVSEISRGEDLLAKTPIILPDRASTPSAVGGPNALGLDSRTGALSGTCPGRPGFGARGPERGDASGQPLPLPTCESGLLRRETSDPTRTSAADLPFLTRIDK